MQHAQLTNSMHWILAALVPLVVVRSAMAEDDVPPARDTVYEHGVVAADHPLASEAGAAMLRQGGNVVDAAVATSFALSVLRPSSCGIGGGGFMVIWDAKQQKAVALDYREVAPAQSSPEMFVNARKKRPDEPFPSREGGLAVGVPGTVAGLLYALEHYGSLDRQTVLAPAIRLAKAGFPIDEHDQSVQRSLVGRFRERPELRQRFPELYRLYLNAGATWGEGDTIRSLQAKALQRIAEHGREGFYDGPVAESIVETVQKHGGVLTREDLKEYQPKVRQPLRGEFRGYDVLTMPPPSSGGVALLETLNILTAYGEEHPKQRLDRLEPNSVPYLHLLTEAMKHAYADRAAFLGDPDFVDVPVKTLTSPRYADALAERITMTETYPPSHYGRLWLPDDAGTSHFSVIDAAGNAVACTETVNTYFGSMVVDPEFGIVLNNEMDDFTAIPGEPNAFGLIQGEANAVAPGKKPLSSMTPTILVEDGQAAMALGASGGPRIISTTIQVLLNMTVYDQPPFPAVARPRIHHQWLPDILYVEDPLFERVEADLEELGHEVRRRNALAVCQAVKRTKDGLRAASDPRKHGHPAGY